jgi:hypothetical protein
VKTSEVRKILNTSRVFVDTLSQSNGVFTVRRGFFYRLDGSAKVLADNIQRALPNAVIIEKGEVYKEFRGGSSVARGSHWYVKFTVSMT